MFILLQSFLLNPRRYFDSTCNKLAQASVYYKEIKLCRGVQLNH